jgi:hypothetical protein
MYVDDKKYILDAVILLNLSKIKFFYGLVGAKSDFLGIFFFIKIDQFSKHLFQVTLIFENYLHVFQRYKYMLRLNC